jgi:hypothetical protein
MIRLRAALRIGALAAILCAMALSAPAQGTNPGAMADQYAASARKNAELTRHYTWQMRIALTLKGDPKPASLYQMRFDADGKLQKTLLSAPPEEKKARGIRGRIKENKIEDFKEWADTLGDLVKDYMAPSPGTMMDFYAKAAYSQSPDGTVQVSAGGFIQPKDKVTFWLDPATKSTRRFAFETVLDEDAVSGQVEFGQVQDGPQYAARVTVNVPGKDVSATVENFNYQRQ